jgi:WhiB family redox-sensing transcriptional regulator
MTTIRNQIDIYAEGACAGSDSSDLFFSDRAEELAQAQDICRRCPVQTECLADALEYGAEWGVWGGVVFRDGDSFYRTRPRGRPRKADADVRFEADRSELLELVRTA